VLELFDDVALDPDFCVDAGAADVDLVVVACESAHAIAPPIDSIAATLPAATARRARHAFGLLRSVAIVSPPSLFGGRSCVRRDGTEAA
jgi:hypothetical protein